MGICVDADHRVLTSAGERSPWMSRWAQCCEAPNWGIAVPELRGQAGRVAETLLGSAHVDELEGQLQLEYMT